MSANKALRFRKKIAGYIARYGSTVVRLRDDYRQGGAVTVTSSAATYRAIASFPEMDADRSHDVGFQNIAEPGQIHLLLLPGSDVQEGDSVRFNGFLYRVLSSEVFTMADIDIYRNVLLVRSLPVGLT